MKTKMPPWQHWQRLIICSQRADHAEGQAQDTMVSLVELQRMMNSQFCHVPTLKLGREWDSTTCDEDI